MSRDGHNWLNGAGEYGGGWGPVGKSITIPQGGSLYIKYYSQSRTDLALRYAPHDAKWGSWNATGPSLNGTIGDSSSNPVILKFSKVGTPRSTVTWMNGSGAWSALTTVGSYDLALHERALWTLPPVTITGAAVPGFWAGLLRVFTLGDTISTGGSGDASTRSFEVSVADAGGTAALLGAALISVAVLWRAVHRRRMHQRKDERAVTG